ncbi:MAG: hypothetical protein JO366_15405, partial [Methylobacteriaceae bacterium]|nr:hypothetical protein [Methylobacteriaceae bacterium]
DLILGQRGFGILANGLLIDVGMAGAIFAADHRIGGLVVTGPVPLAALTCGGATLMLLLFSALKNLAFR